MSENWQVRRLGEISHVGAGNSAPQDESLFENGDHLFVRTADVGKVRFGCIVDSDDKLNNKGIERLRLVPKGSILIPKSGASTFLNYRVILGQDSYVSSHLATVKANTDIVINRYLLYFLSTVRAQEIIQDHKYPSLKLSDIKNIAIKFPCISEQKRIVAILDEAFAGIGTAIANTERNLANARELFSRSSRSIFLESGKWEKRTLSELLELGWIKSHLDGNHGSDYPRKEEFVKEGVPYISANCIKDDAVDFTASKCLSSERASKLRKGIAKDGDVLFAHNATVGPVAVLRTSCREVVLSTSLTYYRCDDRYIRPEYLAHYMRSPLFREQFEAVMRQSTRNQVPITKQRSFIHLVPPLNKQLEIADHLDSLRSETLRLDALYREKCDLLGELKEALLKKAFCGDLTYDVSETDMHEIVE